MLLLLGLYCGGARSGRRRRRGPGGGRVGCRSDLTLEGVSGSSPSVGLVDRAYRSLSVGSSAGLVRCASTAAASSVAAPLDELAE